MSAPFFPKGRYPVHSPRYVGTLAVEPRQHSAPTAGPFGMHAAGGATYSWTYLCRWIGQMATFEITGEGLMKLGAIPPAAPPAPPNPYSDLGTP